MQTFTPDSTCIVHNTSVDFVRRPVSMPIHLVQYDDTAPVIAVELYDDAHIYEIPESATLQLRYQRPDGCVITKQITDYNLARNTIYFRVSYLMAYVPGIASAVIEIVLGSNDSEETANNACSSPIRFEIDRNPVQNDGPAPTPEEREIIEWLRIQVTNIKTLIPEAANPQNKLADMEWIEDHGLDITSSDRIINDDPEPNQ